MRILALDPATVTGFAYGEAGEVPRSGSVRLKRKADGPEVAAFNIAAFLRDRFVFDKPDLVAIEHWIAPGAMKGQDAMLLQLLVHGAAAALCGLYAVPVKSPHVQTWRKHYTGYAHARGRDESKRLVLVRAKQLGHLPLDCFDDNRADAVGIFDYAGAEYGRQRPRELVMFGDGA